MIILILGIFSTRFNVKLTQTADLGDYADGADFLSEP
jgi:hypothetical protein